MKLKLETKNNEIGISAKMDFAKYLVSTAKDKGQENNTINTKQQDKNPNSWTSR